MANITINEVSQNYTYNIGAASYATVAMPITSCWGPGYVEPYSEGADAEEQLEKVTWSRFPATQEGLEAFVAAYRGPVSTYRAVDDYSYQAAMTLLTSGYNVLVCRIAGGQKAQNSFKSASYQALSAAPGDWSTAYSNYFELNSVSKMFVPVAGKQNYTKVDAGTSQPDNWATIYNKDYYTKSGNDYVLNTESDWSTAKTAGIYTMSVTAPQFVANTYYEKAENDSAVVVTAKYPGTFGNNLKVVLQDKGGAIKDGKRTNPLWNMVIYVVDNSGTQVAVENLSFVFDLTNATDSILHVSEIKSAYVDISASTMTDSMTLLSGVAEMVMLRGGTDIDNSTPGDATTAELKLKYWRDRALQFARSRFNADEDGQYVKALAAYTENLTDLTKLQLIADREWVYMSMLDVYTLLKDRMSYSPNRVICCWDDQNIKQFDPDFNDNMTEISPVHIALLDVGYFSRCATPLLDVPRSLPRKYVSIPNLSSEISSETGYAQKLGRYQPINIAYDIDVQLYSSHSAAFAPWGQYTYVGMTRPHSATPSFMALLIQRAMILNQSTQYEWALPTNRRQSININSLDYTVPKKYLDIWQPSPAEGVCVNAITTLPEIGTTIWGNSTLFEIPPATYQALQNLSTRYLYNAVKDIVFRCGIAITYTYNNDQAYSAFYAGVTPTLDTMKNVGAIVDYRVTMSADINREDQVNANSVIGKIELAINGVVNDITVDLIALPPNVSLS